MPWRKFIDLDDLPPEHRAAVQSAGRMTPFIVVLILLYAVGFAWVVIYDADRHDRSERDRATLRAQAERLTEERAESKAKLDELIKRVERLEAGR